MKTLGKKALGWMTAFAVMATLTVSASAADQRVLLDGYRAESGTVESAETGQLSLMGSAITKTGTLRCSLPVPMETTLQPARRTAAAILSQ